MADRHKVTTVYRPSQAALIRLEAIAEYKGIGVRAVIGEAVDEYLANHTVGIASPAEVEGFNRSAQLIDKVNGSAGLFAEARASSA